MKGVSCEVHYEKNSHTLSNLHVPCDSRDASQIARDLDAGTPRIKVNTRGKDTLVINAYTLNPGQEEIIANALRHLLHG